MSLWSLDEMGWIIASSRSMIFEVATKLVAVDLELFTDTIVWWKCLNTEFSAFLMRTGLGSVHRKIYGKVCPTDIHSNTEMSLKFIAHKMR